MSNLDKPYDPRKVEDYIYRKWEESGYFNPDKLKKTKGVYSTHLPPPNVTGSLHMGHALNATLSDILIRFHRMRGKKTVWFPGTDHAGIATQNVVEKKLRKEGKSRWDLGREKFEQEIWEWKNKYGNIIVGQLKKIGASCDWSRLRFTMDDDYAEEVRKVFVHYHKKGWIYQGQRVVSWCPRCQTSLSDLEIEYEEEKTKLWHIKYPLKNSVGGKKFIVVATTRPETMLGDTAVAVNPKDKRYKNLIGHQVVLPIQNREIPIVADEGVEKDFGTGAVKVTPAHDLLDAEIGNRHKLEAIQVIDERGRMTELAGKICAGLKAAECREKVIEELKKENLLEKEESYTHNISRCYRCSTAIQPILSNQWFVKMEDLAKKALKAVRSGKVKIIPKKFEKIYFNWLENIRDWNISRQLWWGHRLPVWFHENKCVPKKGKEGDVGKCEEMIVSLKKPACKWCDAEYQQSEDVLDTWFSSALWPFAGLSKKDLKSFYPSNVLITARDIINLWVARMIYSGLEFQKEIPFPKVLIHATILDKQGRRMSKSLGTGVDPLNLIEQYGADATRFGIVWQSMGDQDIKWDETSVIAGKKFANKLWNIARFVLNNIGDASGKLDKKNLTSADKKVIKKIDETKKQMEKLVDSYKFGQAMRKIYDLTWNDLANGYLEKSKEQLKNDKIKKSTQNVLRYCLIETIKILHPFMPFITEEIYQKVSKKNLLIVAKW